MRASTLFALAAALSPASAAKIYKGFNYGSTNAGGANNLQSDYESQFTVAAGLEGTEGFTSARLYTMIQGGTTNTPISAIPAAINTSTTLLLGLWASAGQADFSNEIAALNSAIATYGDALTDTVAAISVGSEDLYRITPTGIENNSGAGADPSTIVDYINQVRTAIANTPISKAPVGHVDTWTAWVNGSNEAVIDNSDFLGVDAYPYFQNTEDNSIATGFDLFYQAYDNTTAVAKGKPVYVTETGWPVSGAVSGQGVASVANAEEYWQTVGCSLFDQVNTWWYTLQDAGATPSFGVVGADLTTTPLYDLSCSNDTCTV